MGHLFMIDYETAWSTPDAGRDATSREEIVKGREPADAPLAESWESSGGAAFYALAA